MFKCLTAFESQINVSLTGPSGAFRLQSVNGGENCLIVLRIWGEKHNGLNFCGDRYVDIYYHSVYVYTPFSPGPGNKSWKVNRINGDHS